MNRGSGGRQAMEINADVRFNEAPIHESGKWPHHRSSDQRSGDASMRPRFMNRGSETLSWALTFALSASMRPRFMNRGSAMAATTRGAAAPCFNEAPIHESGKSSGQRRGPVPEARFNEAPIHESGKSSG